MPSKRRWMYRRHDSDGNIDQFHVKGVKKFLVRARRHARNLGLDEIRCPCKGCQNAVLLHWQQVEMHIAQRGFVSGYECWIYHGERVETVDEDVGFDEAGPSNDGPPDPTTNEYVDMVEDLLGDHNNNGDDDGVEEPNEVAAKYLRLMEDVNTPLWEGAGYTRLSLTTQLMNVKSESGISQLNFKRFLQIMKGLAPNGGVNIPKDFYEAKKLLEPLFLSCEKIHACVDNCMLFYKETEHLQFCSYCKAPRFHPRYPGQVKPIARKVLFYLPLGPRLQRLYMCRKTASDMTWHAEKNERVGWMSHPRDGEAWKDFNATFPDFSAEPRNVRIGLCTDGFCPFSQFGSPYSCWPVTICVYNLPPGICMKESFIFLSLIIPGPKSPGRDLDVFLRPLVDELKELWSVGVDTYDSESHQNFRLRVALMWTISDFPAYGMLSGWSTHGRLACPYCMETTGSFWLQAGRKHSWFDCHRRFLPPGHPYREQNMSFKRDTTCPGVMQEERKSEEDIAFLVSQLEDDVFGKAPGADQRKAGYGEYHHWTKKSIFWELPYWSKLKLRHNIDFMHTEKNNAENYFFTIMDVKERTKDTDNSRRDLEAHTNRSGLYMTTKPNGKPLKPKGAYTLTKRHQLMVRDWLRKLQMPDGYVSNLARCADSAKFGGLKSHDMHIIMQKLMPIAFQHVLPKAIWEALTELCYFFRDMSSASLNVEHVKTLESSIVVTQCKLEKIFPPAMFDVMEHLPLHMPREALLGGPSQFRWMFQFERLLGRTKRMVRQKAHVEGSIAEAYLLQEVSTYVSMYFGDEVETNSSQPKRNADVGPRPGTDHHLTVFRHSGQPSHVVKQRYHMTDEEWRTAHMYILSNTSEISGLLESYHTGIEETYPHLTFQQRDQLVRDTFIRQFIDYVKANESVIDARFRTLSLGPRREITRYKECLVNGYRFDIKRGGGARVTYNSGVWLKGSTFGDDVDVEYYGVVEEIWELTYNGLNENVILFKCFWFDNETGMKVNPKNGIVQIKRDERGSVNDPFILASQAQQAVYLENISDDEGHLEWVVATKTAARGHIDWTNIVSNNTDDDDDGAFFQQEEQPMPVIVLPAIALDDVDLLIADTDEDETSDDDDDCDVVDQDDSDYS